VPYISTIFKSSDCTGQVTQGILVLFFHSHVILELSAYALPSKNINGYSVKCFATAGKQCVSKIFMYFLESISPSTGHHHRHFFTNIVDKTQPQNRYGASVPTLSNVIQLQNVEQMSVNDTQLCLRIH